MYVSKAITYSSGIPISLNARPLIFSAKITLRLEKLARDKHSSLVGSFKSYEDFFVKPVPGAVFTTLHFLSNGCNKLDCLSLANLFCLE
jgi:hypothetical protein